MTTRKSKKISDLNAKGHSLSEAGLYCESLALHGEALDLLNSEGSRTDEYYQTNRALGDCYNTLGDYAQAQLHYLESCRRDSEGHIISHNDNAHFYIFTGDQLLSQEQREGALEFYTMARDIRASHCGEESTEVADVEMIIGGYYHTIGDLDSSILNIDRACEIYRSTLGENSIEEGRCLTLKSCVIRELEQFEESWSLLNRAEQILLQHGREGDIDRANTLENMALALREEGKHIEAIERINSVIKIYKDHYPHNHHHIAGAHNIWGTILSSEDRLSEALTHYFKALNMQLETLNENHIDLADSYINIGSAYLQQGDIVRAIEYYTLAEQIEGSGHYMGHCHKALGCIALIESRFEDAHHELFRALEIYSNHADRSNIDIVETKCYIEDLRQRIESSIKGEVYMDSQRIVYGAICDDYGVYYNRSICTILNVPTQIGRTLIGLHNDNSHNSDLRSYIECYGTLRLPIPNSVETIGAGAFAMNEGLTCVHLPNVTKVDSLAFEGCQSLCSVHFAEGVIIDESAFEGCNKLDIKS